jgi:hypothetical protein
MSSCLVEVVMKLIHLAGILGIGALSFACSSTSDGGGDGQAADGVRAFNEPLLSVPLEGGTVVSFYETQAGIMVDELGQNGTPSVLEARGLREHSALEIWNAIRPGQALPAQLADAIARAKIAAPDSLAAQEDGQEIVSEPVAQAQQAVTSSQFVAGNGCLTTSNTVRKVCWLDRTNNWNETGTSWSVNVNLASGGGEFTLGMPDQLWFANVPDNFWRQAVFINSQARAVRYRVQVLDAVGDVWHEGVSWYNHL